jgi:hypothetical protein
MMPSRSLKIGRPFRPGTQSSHRKHSPAASSQAAYRAAAHPAYWRHTGSRLVSKAQPGWSNGSFRTTGMIGFIPRLGSAGLARESTKRSLSRGMTEAPTLSAGQLGEQGAGLRPPGLISGLLPAIMTQRDATQHHPRGRAYATAQRRYYGTNGALALAGTDMREATAQGATPTGSEMLPRSPRVLGGARIL